jgi:hypothetical protein
MVTAAALILLLLPAVSYGHEESNKILMEKIAKLEARIKALEERISRLELEVSKLSRQLGVQPAPARGIEGNWSKLERGMTREEVRGILGEPDDIPMHSYLEIWDYSKTYGGSCSVTFDESGKVESWIGPL